MKHEPSGKRTLRRQLAPHPEIAIFCVLFAVATLIYRQVPPGALFYSLIWGASVALGAFWIVIRPIYLQDALPSDVALKSILLLWTGAQIIFAEWLRAVSSEMRMFLLPSETLESGPAEMSAWISVVGGLTAVAGLAGLVLCKRISVAFHSRSATFIRACAAVVALVAMLLVVIATMAGIQIIRLASEGG